MTESPVRTKMIAGLCLIAVSTVVGVLYKASQSVGGGFKYSTISAICIAELIKLCMSSTMHVLDQGQQGHQSIGRSAITSAVAVVQAELSLSAIFHIWVLSALYTFNNQLSFFVYTLVDPGTVFLFKSASTIIVAIVQCSFAGKTFSREQWRAMMLQAVGMVIVQYNPCNSRGLYSPEAYGCLVFSAIVTGVTASRNEHLVKNYKISLNVQNATLYAGGFFMNFFAFFLLPNVGKDGEEIGFFDGYGLLACGVVSANAVIGLAITAVYKYADAVVKCIAGDITAIILMIISSFFFGLQASLSSWAGVFVVCFAVHLYLDATSALAAAKSAEAAVTPPQPAEPNAQTIGIPSKGAVGGALSTFPLEVEDSKNVSLR